MVIKNLRDVPLSHLVDCLLTAFSDYFVKMPTDMTSWENRFKGARVDYDLSYGMFFNERLVGFIINGIDYHQGELAAFNSGTGVLPEFRSRRVVDQLYTYALPHFQEKGITKCMLEVIQKNDRAIRVYERIGFRIKRELKCYHGRIQGKANLPAPKKVPFQDVMELGYPDREFYSWDNSHQAIQASGNLYTSWLVRDPMNRPVGYFTINPDTGYVARLYAEREQYDLLLEGMALICDSVKLNNIDRRRSSLLKALEQAGLENHIDQYEMEMSL